MSLGTRYEPPPRELTAYYSVEFLPSLADRPELKPLDGFEERVRDFVLMAPGARGILSSAFEVVNAVLPQVTEVFWVGFGCARGRYRSLVAARELHRMLEEARIPAVTYHRDLDERPQRNQPGDLG